MRWSWVDAVNLAIDLIGLDEYHGMDVDTLANDLWREMQEDDGAAAVAGKGD